jgi:parallel beta-helix repeat protein
MRVLQISVLACIAAVGVAPSLMAPSAAGAAAPKVHCGQTIRTNIRLTRDLRNCPGDGLVVGANNITINLNGHTLLGSGKRGTAGVRVTGFHGATVKSGVIRHFGRGVWLVTAVDGRIVDNTIRNSFDEGIFASKRSSRPIILRNRVSGSGEISGATFADGVDARGNGTRVRGNTVRHSRDDGIDVNGDDDVVEQNTVVGSHSDGIDVDGFRTLVEENLSVGNGDDGIGVGVHGGQVTIEENTADYNFDLGIQPKRGTAHGEGNKAEGNGDPRQCVVVECS